MDIPENAEGWRPDEGAVLIGRVVKVDLGWSDYTGSHYPIVTVQPAQGDPVAVHGFHTALRARLMMLKPMAGETIGFRYHGKRPTKDGRRDVATYTVKVKGRDADVWGTLGTAAPPQPAAGFTPRTVADTPVPSASELTPVDDDDIPF